MAKNTTKGKSGHPGLQGVRNSDLYPNANYTPTEQDLAIDRLVLGAKVGNYNSMHGHIGYDALHQPSLFEIQEANDDRQKFTERLDNSLYNYGASGFDTDILVNPTQEDIQNTRAYNEPWWLKITNGVAKGGVTAVTTALEGIGLVYGIGQGLHDAYNAEDGKGLEAFGHGFWDNPITKGLRAVNEFSEEVMPNYYSSDEMANPLAWRNIFSANTLGDKIIKNFGFMVGAFYGGIPASSLIGKIGTRAVKAAREAQLARRAGMGAKAAALERQAEGDKEMLARMLKEARLTDTDFKNALIEGNKHVQNIAQVTRRTSKVIGSLGSALNEGAIEAINNSNDWANGEKQKAYDEYQAGLRALENNNTEMREPLKIALAEKYNKRLEEIEKGKARMGNADLLLNIPILTASNIFQLGKLYQRGFDSTRRTMKGMFRQGLSGSLRKGTLKPVTTNTKAWASAIMKANTEGMEEYFQRAASDGAGQAVSDSITEFINSGKGEEARNNVGDYILGFANSIVNNFGDESAMDEYFVGAVSSLIGMPVVGSQTKNAYIGKNGPIGLAGGLVGNLQDEFAKKEHETAIANYLNQRVKSPELKALWHNMFAHNDLEARIHSYIAQGDKKEAKDKELEQLVKDINAAASSGHLDEFLDLVSYDESDFTPKALAEIVDNTIRPVTAAELKARDEEEVAYYREVQNDLLNDIGGLHDYMNKHPDAPDIEDKRRERELLYSRHAKATMSMKAAEDRLLRNEYQNTTEGPFIDKGGRMDIRKDANGVVGGEMIGLLKRNQEEVLDTVHDILNIRNEIDVETDGRLDDKDIELLTMMRAKINDYDKRSAQMASHLLSALGLWEEESLGDLQYNVEYFEGVVKDYQKKLDNLTTDNSTSKDRAKARKNLRDAEEKLEKAKASMHGAESRNAIVDALMEEEDRSHAYKRAFRKRAGRQGDLAGRKNSDEVSALMSHFGNTIALISAIKKLRLSDSKKAELIHEALDLHVLGKQKLEYNKMLKKFLDHPDSINEAFQRAEDRISQEERDNKVNEFSLRIKEATSLTELDTTMNDLFKQNPEFAQAALDKEEKEGVEEKRQLISDYKKAVSFYRAFHTRLYKNKTSENVAQSINSTLTNIWNYALAQADPHKSIIDSIHQAIKDLKKHPDPTAQEAGALLEKVMNDLDEGARSIMTAPSNRVSHNRVDVSEGMTYTPPSSGTPSEGSPATTPSATSEEDKGKDKKADEDKKGEDEDKKDEDKGKKDEEKREVKRDDVISAIEDYIESQFLRGKQDLVEIMSSLRKNIQEDLDTYNQEHTDDQIGMYTFKDFFTDLLENSIKEEGIKDDNDEASDEVTESRASDMATFMKGELGTTFKSGTPTQWMTKASNGSVLYCKVPYEPTGDNASQWKEVQEFLKHYCAYDFVDHNYLGYIFQHKGTLPIYFIRSKYADRFGSSQMTFMAIEWDDQAEEAIKQRAFDGGSPNIVLNPNIKLVRINGKSYQIVGLASVDSLNAVDKIKTAFREMQEALDEEFKDSMSEEAWQEGNEEQFNISKLTSEVSSIFTGRLDKHKNGESQVKIGLDEFQNNSGATEGVAILGYLSLRSMEYYTEGVNRDMIVLPSIEYMGKEKHMGAIMLFLPKPDGKFYPVRLSRRTVGEWLKDKGNTILDSLLKGEITPQSLNPYFASIAWTLDQLVIAQRSNVQDDNKDGDDAKNDDDVKNESVKNWQIRMSAKNTLSRMFCFGKGNSPISFIDGEDGFSVRLGENMKVFKSTGPQLLKEFLEFLADNKVKFSVPKKYSDIKSLVSAGIFDINIKGYYNFNASFTVKPIDKKGNKLTDLDAELMPGSAHRRKTERTYSIDSGEGSKERTFIITGTRQVMENGKRVDSAVENLVLFLEEVESNGQEALLQLSGYAGTDDANAFSAFVFEKKPAIESVKVLTVGTTTWVYDPRKHTGGTRVYTVDSKEGKKLKDEIENLCIQYLDEKVKELEKEKKPEPKPASTRISTKDGSTYQQDDKGLLKMDDEDYITIENSTLDDSIRKELGELQKNGAIIIHRNGLSLEEATGFVAVGVGTVEKVTDNDGNYTIKDKVEIVLINDARTLEKYYEDKSRGTWGNNQDKGKKDEKKDEKKDNPPSGTNERFNIPWDKLCNGGNSTDPIIKKIQKNLAKSYSREIYELIQEAERNGAYPGDGTVIPVLEKFGAIRRNRSIGKDEKDKQVQQVKSELENTLKGCNKK